MAVVKRRGAARKVQTRIAGLRRRLITSKIRNEGQFGVHEDLLCQHSKYFEDRLQKNRKTTDGVCSICYGPLLDPKSHEAATTVFCKSGFGQNFHKNCMATWMTKSRSKPVTCPMCRTPWNVNVEEVSNQDAVQTYVDWLYTGKAFQDDIDRANEGFFMTLLKAWKVSDAVGDDDFRKDIIAKYFKSMSQHGDRVLPLACVKYAYEDVHIPGMRMFIVEASIESWDVVGVASGVDEYPQGFTKDLCVHAMAKAWEWRGTKRDDVLREYTGGDYFLEDTRDKGSN
ncbi:hypothetical protein G6011_11420 [Alternaria panax]|uniref:RING-type domain-containing protein n=1 Tax=Alternaria panax TaxID=48097 RepID=A0AAD4IDD1_9PLEO|nr:hypothetical protein G6011_11420 [Alternaria panax]